MSDANRKRAQQGMALVVSLLFLLVLTMIGVVAATNSRYALQMSGNIQDELQSFQAAEAGVYAALATSGTATDLFMGFSKDDVFGDFADEDNPLAAVATGNGVVTTAVILTASARGCPRRTAATASSVTLFDCDYYRIESQHDWPQRARTKIDAGVVKTIIGNSVRN